MYRIFSSEKKAKKNAKTVSNLYMYRIFSSEKIAKKRTKDKTPLNKTHPYSTLQVPTTKLAKMSIDLKFVELTADVLDIFFLK